ncbi:MAG: hypothetical protein Q9191_000451 [Dirinaria sp. TL-2023a]
MVQTRSKSRAAGGTIQYTGITTNSLGLAPKGKTGKAPSTPATTSTTTAAARSPIRKAPATTRRRGKAKAAKATAPASSGPSTNPPLPAASVPAAAGLSTISPPAATTANTADASTQVNFGGCPNHDRLVRRVNRKDATIRELNDLVKQLVDENNKLRKEYEGELRCHNGANEELMRLANTIVVRRTPDSERFFIDEGARYEIEYPTITI